MKVIIEFGSASRRVVFRVKNTYIEHKEIRAAQGVKIAAKELDKAIAGLNLLVANQPDEVQICKDEISARLSSALNSIKVKDRGVFVQASTLGSLEALLEFLRTSKIPYAGVKIGPVVKRDVMRASVMLEHKPKYTIILAFDVKVERDAQEMADKEGVKIFQVLYLPGETFSEPMFLTYSIYRRTLFTICLTGSWHTKTSSRPKRKKSSNT